MACLFAEGFGQPTMILRDVIAINCARRFACLRTPEVSTVSASPSDNISAFVNRQWDEEIVPKLIDYIRIPNKSPSFDPDWQQHGYMEEASSM